MTANKKNLHDTLIDLQVEFVGGSYEEAAYCAKEDIELIKSDPAEIDAIAHGLASSSAARDRIKRELHASLQMEIS